MCILFCRQVAISGFLDDYAFLIRGLIDLYESTLDTKWLQWAETLQDTQNAKFWDAQHGGYFSSPEGDSSILFRGKEGKLNKRYNCNILRIALCNQF